MTWIISVEGFGAFICGKLFAVVHNQNLNRAMPNLIAEMKALSR
jgi:hypothetical protein